MGCGNGGLLSLKTPPSIHKTIIFPRDKFCLAEKSQEAGDSLQPAQTSAEYLQPTASWLPLIDPATSKTRSEEPSQLPSWPLGTLA